MINTDPIIMDRDKIQTLNDANKAGNRDSTPIQQFYSESSVLITGSTGFLGKILLEKLIRSCQDVSTIFLLVRSKKGKNLHERIDEIFDDIVFDRMKKECPKFRHKVVGVGGDCSLPNLGLSDQDVDQLVKEVSIVFHVAATVRFDEKLKTAVDINVRAPRDLLVLAHKMPKLKSFMHVSTAFGNCTGKIIEEKVYPAASNYNKLISMTENVPENILDNITPTLLDKYPNTYAFTKQIAEEVVKDEGNGLPVGIFRPSIVIATYQEPIKAWINNMYGPTGIAAGAGLGLLRALHCDQKCNANLVPVDMCVNCLIATAWEVSTSFEKAKEDNIDFEIPVFNYESSNDNLIDWHYFMKLLKRHGLLNPSTKAIWYYSFNMIRNYYLYLLATFILHTIPAMLVDGALLCIGKPQKMMKIYSKIHKFSKVLSYFSTKEWIFKSQNVRKLNEKMSIKDKSLFFNDLKALDWSKYFELYYLGIRLYLIKDPIETLPEARKKWNRLFWAHQAVKALAGFLLLRILWSLISLLFSYLF